MRIVGIDPGKTTGVCRFEDNRFISGDALIEYSAIGDYIIISCPDIIVMEDFIVSRRPAEARWPFMVMGVIEYVATVPVVYQSPSILKLMLPKVLHLSSNPHVRSACAHVMYYWLSKRS